MPKGWRGLFRQCHGLTPAEKIPPRGAQRKGSAGFLPVRWMHQPAAGLPLGQAPRRRSILQDHLPARSGAPGSPPIAPTPGGMWVSRGSARNGGRGMVPGWASPIGEEDQGRGSRQAGHHRRQKTSPARTLHPERGLSAEKYPVGGVSQKERRQQAPPACHRGGRQ